MSEHPESTRRYITPAWPEGQFNLVAEKAGILLGPFTADGWGENDDGSALWADGVTHPVNLRVRMQAGDLIYANDGDIGQMTYRIVPLAGDGEQTTSSRSDPFDVMNKLSALLAFLDRAPLTGSIAELEYALEDSVAEEVPKMLGDHGVSPAVLEAGFVARDRLGRVSDVIHALSIALCLPELLEPGEFLFRPSLAAGNDPSRPFDLQTDRRIAEFKLAQWDGHDAGRQRHLVKDLVHLAAVESGPPVELYVMGERPLRFLTETRSTLAWALDRFPKTQATLEERWPDLSLDTPIPAFRANEASHVHVQDLTEVLGRALKPGPQIGDSE